MAGFVCVGVFLLPSSSSCLPRRCLPEHAGEDSRGLCALTAPQHRSAWERPARPLGPSINPALRRLPLNHRRVLGGKDLSGGGVKLSVALLTTSTPPLHAARDGHFLSHQENKTWLQNCSQSAISAPVPVLAMAVLATAREASQSPQEFLS